MRMDDLGAFAKPHENGPFRNSLTRGISIAADVYLRRWESQTAARMDRAVVYTSTIDASEANKIRALSK